MGAPLIGAQLLAIGNGMVDTLVAGRLGRIELAAAGIGASLLFVVLLAGIGLMAGLSPSMAKLIGEGRQKVVGALFRQGIWLGSALGLLGVVLLSFINLSLVNWPFDKSLIPGIQDYVAAARWCLLPAIAMLAARNLCEATGRALPVLAVQAVGLLVNLIGDLALGLGWFGAPKLGITGIGWTTTIVNITMCLTLFWMVRRPGFRRFEVWTQFDVINWREIQRLLSLSLPICVGLLFEAGLFVATTIQMGFINPVAASAHNIAMGITAFCYMLPLGLGFALTARVGKAYGRRQANAVFLRVRSGLCITLIMAIVTAIFLAALRHPLTLLYTNDTEVRSLAAHLLLLAVLFQFSDAFQNTQIAMLRGLHDTRLPMLINAFSYWAIGFGVGYVANHHLGFGAAGLWFGLIAGLTTSAVLMAWRLNHQLKRLAAKFTYK